ncbi:MAG: hypothetical protein ACLQPD_23160, partial [Desulfomonilaceae bacterium]
SWAPAMPTITPIAKKATIGTNSNACFFMKITSVFNFLVCFDGGSEFLLKGSRFNRVAVAAGAIARANGQRLGVPDDFGNIF